MKRDVLCWWGIVCLVFSVLCLFLVMLATFAQAEHTDQLLWMIGYASAEGTGCCSSHDCKPAQVRLLAQEGDTVTVEVNGVTLMLPAKSVHRSEVPEAYLCAKSFEQVLSKETVRCVFYASGV